MVRESGSSERKSLRRSGLRSRVVTRQPSTLGSVTAARSMPEGITALPITAAVYYGGGYYAYMAGVEGSTDARGYYRGGFGG